MPTVPYSGAPQVQSNSLPATRFAAPQPQPVMAEQLKQTGQAMVSAGLSVAQIFAAEQEEANKTVAKEADRKALAEMSAALYDPKEGYLVRQGKDAVDNYESTVGRLQEIRRKTIDGLANAQVRGMASEAIDVRLQHAMDTLNRHVGKETKTYQVQTSDSRALASIQDAAFNPTDDKRFVSALSDAYDEAATQGRLHGWDELTTRLKGQQYTDSAYRMRYESWAMQDPVGAFASFMDNQRNIAPLARDTIGRQLFQHAAPALAQELNNTGGAGVVNSPKGDMALPRGVRNNNPGNIIRGTDKWDGEIDGHDPRYASFASPEAGIRAMGRLLLTYQDKHKLNTVEGIVGRWAPATENDTGSYVATVSKALGVKPNAPIDLRDQNTLTKLTTAMIKVENGSQPYTDQQIATGLASATGNTPLPATASPRRDPATPTGIALIDQLPSDMKQRVMQLAQSQARQNMAEAREGLRQRVQDSTAEYLANGVASNPPSEQEFIRAYGQADGPRHFSQLQGVAVLGQTLQSVKTLPTRDLLELVKTNKPAPGDGFAERQQNYQILTKAVEQVTKARNDDPVGYALTAGGYAIQPIRNFADPQALAQELGRRAGSSRQIAADYGTQLQTLSKDEAKFMGDTLKAMSVENQKQHLATIFKGVGDMGLFKQTMQSIAPDLPTVAVAGVYQARGNRTNDKRDVADLILRGQAILTPNKKEDGSGHMGGASLVKMPEDRIMLSEWASQTGDAFKGREQSADLFMQTARAIYAARSAEDGDYSGVYSAKRWKSAINLATGGIERHNGSSVVMPYGLPYDQFQDRLSAEANRLTKSGEVPNIAPRDLLRLQMENVGDGRYLFRRGAGYLVNKDGRPVVVDLNGG